ncbi:hypothetical protein A0J61_10962, partial [Choanephora cucurbitarum]
MPATSTNNCFVYCFCDVCKYSPREDRFITRSIHRSHKLYRKYNGMAYQDWVKTYNGQIAKNTPSIFIRAKSNTSEPEQTLGK